MNIYDRWDAIADALRALCDETPMSPGTPKQQYAMQRRRERLIRYARQAPGKWGRTLRHTGLPAEHVSAILTMMGVEHELK